jgi:tetratricopeptide (TPR) repeat protein
MPLPSSFLIDAAGQIVKIYQGEVDIRQTSIDAGSIPSDDAARLKRGLPFHLLEQRFEFERNYLSLGSIFFQAGYTDAAGDFFLTAAKRDADSAEAYYGLGSVYLRQEKNGPAKDCFQKVTKLRAVYPETLPNAWNNLGLIAIRENESALAESCFQQALAVNPVYFIAMVNLGNAYKQQRRWEDARATLLRALVINSADPEANYSLGMVYAQMGDSKLAYECLQKALDERPVYPEALNNLGVLYLRTHRPDDAVATFQKCISLAPAFDQSYLNLATVYTIEGKSERAKSVLRALLGQHPDNLAGQRALEDLH